MVHGIHLMDFNESQEAHVPHRDRLGQMNAADKNSRESSLRMKVCPVKTLQAVVSLKRAIAHAIELELC